MLHAPGAGAGPGWAIGHAEFAGRWRLRLLREQLARKHCVDADSFGRTMLGGRAVHLVAALGISAYLQSFSASLTRAFDRPQGA